MYHKVDSGLPSIRYAEAVEEALCFGWIDSTVNTVTAHSNLYYLQLFTRRKPKSTWSRVNKQRVAALRAQGLMTPAGEAVIDVAMRNGSWKLLDDVEDLRMDADLKEALQSSPGTMDAYEQMNSGAQKALLYRISLAKGQTTKEKYIQKAVDACREFSLDPKKRKAAAVPAAREASSSSIAKPKKRKL